MDDTWKEFDAAVAGVILQELHTSNISVSLGWGTGNSIEATLRNSRGRIIATERFGEVVEAVAWLRDVACEAFPQSAIASKCWPADPSTPVPGSAKDIAAGCICPKGQKQNSEGIYRIHPGCPVHAQRI